MDPASIPTELARVPAGTRIRLFWREHDDRLAASGALGSLAGGRVRIAPDDGGELEVALADVTCFYVPKPIQRRASRFAPLRAALARLAPQGDPIPLARAPEARPEPPEKATTERPMPEEPAATARRR